MRANPEQREKRKDKKRQRASFEGKPRTKRKEKVIGWKKSRMEKGLFAAKRPIIFRLKS